MTKSMPGSPGVWGGRENQSLCFWALFPGSRAQSQGLQSWSVALGQLTTSSTFMCWKHTWEFLATEPLCSHGRWSEKEGWTTPNPGNKIRALLCQPKAFKHSARQTEQDLGQDLCPGKRRSSAETRCPPPSLTESEPFWVKGAGLGN